MLHSGVCSGRANFRLHSSPFFPPCANLNYVQTNSSIIEQPTPPRPPCPNSELFVPEGRHPGRHSLASRKMDPCPRQRDGAGHTRHAGAWRPSPNDLKPGAPGVLGCGNREPGDLRRRHRAPCPLHWCPLAKPISPPVSTSIAEAPRKVHHESPKIRPKIRPKILILVDHVSNASYKFSMDR